MPEHRRSLNPGSCRCRRRLAIPSCPKTLPAQLISALGLSVALHVEVQIESGFFSGSGHVRFVVLVPRKRTTDRRRAPDLPCVRRSAVA
jgi:hypothetical protein